MIKQIGTYVYVTAQQYVLTVLFGQCAAVLTQELETSHCCRYQSMCWVVEEMVFDAGWEGNTYVRFEAVAAV